MSPVTFLIISAIFVISVCCAGEHICGDNEIEEKCASDCEADYCPKNELSDRSPCPRLKEPCTTSCKCRINYRRVDNGTCIPTENCPPFDCSIRPNERFDPCPPYCPTDDCRQATPDGRCPLPGVILTLRICSPKCRCIEGYWRKNGVCVPYAECPNKQTSYSAGSY